MVETRANVMAPYGIHEPFSGHLVQDAFLPRHPASMALSAPSGMSISLSTAAYHHEDYNYTPRTVASHHSLLPGYAVHDYPHGGIYTISSNSASERGRSSSGESTVSGVLSLQSPRTVPTSPHLLKAADGQYPTPLADGTILTNAYATLSQTQLPPCEIKQEVVAPQRTNSSDSAKTVTDDRVFCRHEHCQDENGNPRKFFSRKADVTRHIKSQHDVKYQDCPRLRCERKGKQGFTRRDHLTEHLRGFHMENHPKRKKRAGKDDNKKQTLAAQDFAPTDVEMPASQSRASDSDAPADRPIKTKVKMQGARYHPYARRPSKKEARPASAEVKCQDKSPRSSVSPRFEPSHIMEHQTLYADHQTMMGPYTTEHMMSAIYATHQNMDSYYVTSMGQAYHGLTAPDPPPYQDTHPDDFHFQPLHN